ncbi:hypothetical protein [Streptomyces chartreusis]|uniref:hypothetical protein n=1 Tax=Streptomyces chartreusis TaxID=1969 RepID=UPI00382C50C0
MSEPIRISISESKGPVERLAHISSDGTTVNTMDWGTTCPGCNKIPAAGQKITRIFYAWWHATCGAAYLRSTAADEAWLALGHQLERAPSKFSTAETKGIVRNLLRLAGAAGVVQDGVDSRSLHGPAVKAALPASGEEEFAEVVDGFHHSDLYAAFLQVEQRYPGELPVVAGVRMWALLDVEQQARYTNEVLGAYVELVRIQRDEDRREGF